MLTINLVFTLLFNQKENIKHGEKNNKPVIEQRKKMCCCNNIKLQYCAKVIEVNFNKIPYLLEFEENLTWSNTFLHFHNVYLRCTMWSIYLLVSHAGFKSLMMIHFHFSIKCKYSVLANFVLINCTEVFCFYLFQYPGHEWKPRWTWKAWTCWKTGKYKLVQWRHFTQGTRKRGKYIKLIKAFQEHFITGLQSNLRC